MFCENGLIKIYLMVLITVCFLHYCQMKETTVTEKLVPEDITNYLERRTRTNYNRYLVLPHINRKRKTKDRILKQKLEDQIFQQNLQLLQDQSKISLLKLQNSYLENYHIKSPDNKYQAPIQPKYSIQNSSTNSKSKLRIRRDDGVISEKTECGDTTGEEEVTIEEVTTEEVAPEEVTIETNKQLFEEIVDDLDEIRESSFTQTEKGKTCQLNGTWISDIVGVGFNISFCVNSSLRNDTNIRTTTTTTTTTENPKNVNLNQTESIFIGGAVDITSFEAPLDEDGNHMKLLNCSWDIKARIPFFHTTMLIITAEYAPENRVAVFIGQCRYCDKTEMVTGQWMIHKLVHDCRKIQTAQDVFGDVLRRQPRSAC